MNKPRAIISVVLVALAGCGESPQSQESLSVTVPRQQVNAEHAKGALIALIRGNPSLFEGHPDPDRLQGLSLEESESGRYHLGKFEIDVARRRYSALIGGDRWMVSYNGEFQILRDGTWVASMPQIQNFDSAPPPVGR